MQSVSASENIVPILLLRMHGDGFFPQLVDTCTRCLLWVNSIYDEPFLGHINYAALFALMECYRLKSPDNARSIAEIEKDNIPFFSSLRSATNPPHFSPCSIGNLFSLGWMHFPTRDLWKYNFILRISLFSLSGRARLI